MRHHYLVRLAKDIATAYSQNGLFLKQTICSVIHPSVHPSVNPSRHPSIMLRRTLSSSFWQLLKCDSTHFDCLRRGLAWLCTCISSLVHQTRLANWNKCGLHAYDTCINYMHTHMCVLIDAEYNWFVCTQIYVYICIANLLYSNFNMARSVLPPVAKSLDLDPFTVLICFCICTCAAGNPKMLCMRSRLIFILSSLSCLCCFSFTSISSLHRRKTSRHIDWLQDALTTIY